MLSERIRKSIKKKMLDKDVKGIDLAEKFGVSKQYISAILTGKVSNDEMERKLLEWKKGE